jgi:hypothetical protein
MRTYNERWVDCAAAAAAYDQLSAVQREFKNLSELGPGLLARIRGQDEKGMTLHTRLMHEDSINQFAARCGVPPATLLANGDGLNPLKPKVQMPVKDAPKFTIIPPPNDGANWKPDPSHVDEDKGYQFGGHFEVEASVACDTAYIGLNIVRDEHLAICTEPGKASYHNGPLPGEKRKFGYVLIDGEEEFVDANFRFLRLVRAKAGQKVIVAISRWCRAIGMSRDELRTLSIEYWLEVPIQMVIIEYVYAGKRYVEDHVFEFTRDIRMVLTNIQLRAIE